MLSSKTQWIALVYSVPANPSKARVFVWRKLRSIGAQALRPGLALLPNKKEGLSAFESLAKKIREFTGDAVIIEMNFVDPVENEEMRKRFFKADENALKDTLSECAALLDRMNKATDPNIRTSIQKELEKKLHRFHKSPTSSMREQADELEQAVGTLFDTLRGLPVEFAAMLRSTGRKDF